MAMAGWFASRWEAVGHRAFHAIRFVRFAMLTRSID